MKHDFDKRWQLVFVLCLAVTVLSACQRSQASSSIPVSIHAVNYSDQEIQYYLQDPTNEANSGGGEAINRFAAGGIMCCYTLPKKWQPGSKIKVVYDVVFPAKNGGKIETKKEVALLDIPQYAVPQELWLVRDAEGMMSIVLSNFEPGHPNWPGKVKGWPVPTLEYYRERADIYIRMSRGYVKSLQELSNGMRDDPDKTAKGMWDLSEKFDRKANAGYSGYQDPKYQKFLAEDFKKSLADEKETLKKLEAERP